MRVLMQTRPDYLSFAGGDTVQLLETSRSLRQLGIEVEISSASGMDYRRFDLVHLFNLTRIGETFTFCNEAKAAGLPVVLSPIYWDMGEYLEQARGYSPGNCRLLEPHQEKLRQEVLQQADLLLPNARGEAEAVAQGYGYDGPQIVVPNGARREMGRGRATLFSHKYGWRDFILVAARVEERKNQLSLVRAVRDLGWPVVLAGAINEDDYWQQIQRDGAGVVRWVGRLEGWELAAAFAAARVHVLPSWYETPGLASLEAGLAGCRIVTTDRGTAAEYFGRRAWYCDPGEVTSIRAAVMAAWQTPPPSGLRAHILKYFTWERAAQLTLLGYERVLRSRYSVPSTQYSEVQANLCGNDDVEPF